MPSSSHDSCSVGFGVTAFDWYWLENAGHRVCCEVELYYHGGITKSMHVYGSVECCMNLSELRRASVPRLRVHGLKLVSDDI